MTRPRDRRDVGAWVQRRPRSRAALAGAVCGRELRPSTELSGVAQPAPPADGMTWWAVLGAALAALVLLAILARYATSALKARPRASKSTN